MDSLIVALLVANLVLLLTLVVIGGVCIYLCYKTLVRPEAPCFAGALAAQQQPRFGMMSIDPSHPAYSALAKKIASGEKPPDGTADKDRGQYL